MQTTAGSPTSMSGHGDDRQDSRIEGSLNILFTEDPSVKKGRPWRGNSIMEMILLALAGLFLLTTIIFIALYASKSNNDGDSDVCTSMNCVTNASFIAQKMDQTVDPCDNFADYACGGYYREAVIPSGSAEIGPFATVQWDSSRVLQEIIQEPLSDSDQDYLKKAKMFYQTCLDEDTIEKLGARPYMNSGFSEDWPTLNSSTWDPTKFDINKLIRKYARYLFLPVGQISLQQDAKEPSRNAIHLDQPEFLVSSRSLRTVSGGRIVTALQIYYTNLAVEFGADNQTATKDAQDYISLLVKLANIDFRGTLRAIFENVGITLQNDQKIIIASAKFFEHLENVLQKADGRAIQNLFGFAYADCMISKLSRNFRKLKSDFKMVKDGTETGASRRSECLTQSSGVFGKGLGKEFVKRTFPEESKTQINRMIDVLENSLSEILKATKWMGDETKKEALLKLERLTRKIGYPDTNYTESDINDYYKPLTMVQDNFYQSGLNVVKFVTEGNLMQLSKPVDKGVWTMEPFDTNAYYNPGNNEIVFPAGILQRPFFSDQFPESLNYGGIGTVIGHEITHGLDDTGSQYDHAGILRNWWKPKDFKEFKTRTQCIIDQYSNFEDPQLKMKLNGIISAGENIADAGGVKEAFRAYKMSGTDELPLPGLGLTTDQQFFLAYSQLRCAKKRNETLKDQILNDEHSPGRFRIIGALQNSEDFARVFHCPVGSYMNPLKKCGVW